ncbi:MAG: alpha/beta hydrolase [Spirochaetaceae bacterium]|nr:MAG: alpha/beta hydrolase [Spirochaetaceae bacterium]
MADATGMRTVRPHRPGAGWCGRLTALLAVICVAGHACVSCATWGLLADFRYGLRVTNDAVPPDVPAVRRVAFSTFDDYSLALDLFFPPEPVSNPHSYPLIVHLHGGGWVTGVRSAGAAVPEIEALVSRGYVVASIDYRLAPEHRFPAALEDLELALGYLHEHAHFFGFSSDRVGLLATSAGAHLALLYVLGVNGAASAETQAGATGDAATPDARWQPGMIGLQVGAVVAMYGPTDLCEYLRGVRKVLLRRVFGVRSIYDPVIVEASPFHCALEDAPPILLIHGDRDRLVDPAQSRKLAGSLEEAGTEGYLLVVSGAGHSLRPVFRQPMEPDRQGVTALVVEFFDAFLAEPDR